MENTYLNDHIKAECTGCGACAQVCGKNAVAMRADSEGFFYPVIDSSRCVNCGKCTDVCPHGKNSLFNEQTQYVCGGYTKDSSVLAESTSGGAFTMIAEGWCVGDHVIFGAYQKTPLVVEHGYITDIRELHKFRKSKYSQSRMGSSYADCRRFLEEGKRVLFSGTPCQIAGLKSFLGGKSYDNLLTVDVICEGVPTPKYITKFITHMERKYKSSVSEIVYRDKAVNRWDYEVMYLRFRNGRKISIDRWANPFYDLWMQHIMSRPSCYECSCASTRRCSDISIGDLWGVHIFCPELYNHNRGCSLIICNTEQGKKLLDGIRGKMILTELEMETVLKYCGRMREPIPKDPRRQEFFDDAAVMDFSELKRKWYKKPTAKLLVSKYIWGTNRQVVRSKMKK